MLPPLLRAPLRVRLGAFMAALALVVAAPTAAHAVVIAAAGDIACDPADPSFNNGLGTATACRQKWTSDLLLTGADDVLTLGDNQYNAASFTNFLASYDLSWGRVKAKTFPAIGNHEGTTATTGAGYCRYFGVVAHCNSSGTQGNAAFYSTDIGGWHVIALNSNCTAAGGCDVGSAQYTWLQNDLAAHPATCTLAFWHHPRFSTGNGGSNTFMQPIWKLLYDNGADLVLSGHSHEYERFAPMDGNGAVNRTDGMREFIAGTGGNSHEGFSSSPTAGTEVRNNTTYGVLKLTLGATGYGWQFVPESGTFTDSGSGTCRGATIPPDTERPSTPSALTATAPDSTQVKLSWTASSDNVGVTGYEIWRAPAGGTATKIATTTGIGTTYTDTTVTGGQSYDYHVVARDAAGNTSLDSNTARVTVPAGATLTFTPTADSSVKQASPTTNFGTSTTLGSDSGSGVAIESYLRFNVSGVGSAAVKSAKLRMFVPSDGTADGPGAYGCTAAACGTWTETGINWNNRPTRTTSATADTGSIAAGTTVSYDVTPLIKGDGTVTVVVGPTPTTDGTAFSSRQATTVANRPQLVVTTGAPAAPDTQAPTTPSGLTASAPSSSQVNLSWTAASDNIGVAGYEIWRAPAGGTATKIATSTGTGTTYADTTVTGGQSYDYHVVARDAAGNRSGDSNTATIAVPAGGTTLIFTPVADSSVKQASPTTNFGTSTTLGSDSGSGVAIESYLRFTVAGVGSATIKSAKLRLLVPSDPTANGPGVYGCTALECGAWTESAITWNNRPARALTATADVGAIAAGSTVDYDVTPLVKADGSVTLVIGPTPTTDGTAFSSRQATANRPQLIVTT